MSESTGSSRSGEGLEGAVSCGRWDGGGGQGTPSLSRNCLAEEVIGVVKPLLLDEGSVFENGAKPIGGTRIHKPRDIVSGSQVLTGRSPLGRQFLPLARH